jgi:hypothetical protein
VTAPQVRPIDRWFVDLEKRGVFADPASREGRDFVYRRSAAGASLQRDLLVPAWTESARPGAGDPRPHDPINPQYDPATPSAPAPMQGPLQ